MALGLALASVTARPAHAQGRGAQGPPVDQSVPNDLRSLLTPRRSELRLVVMRYAADRAMLAGNYAGAEPRRGPRGAPADSAAIDVPVSRARIARLRRFDLSWQAALARLDTASLSSAGRSDLDSLRRLVAASGTRLDDEAATLATIAPLVPFAQPLVDLIEARIRIRDVDGERAGGTLTAVDRQIAAARARPAVTSRDQALLAATATETLRQNLASWFTFYDGYDPLFTWWAELPYKHVDESLKGYAAFLREQAASAPQTAAVAPNGAAGRIDAAPAPPFAEVPNLREIVALPQDEMTDVVQRFVGSGGTGRAFGGRGNTPGAAARDTTYYRGWLAALRTLDFDRLSRNAQVDYLYIRSVAERQLARAGTTLPANPPRKTDDSGIPGAARGREGLVRDLQDELIPYTPEQLIALAEKEFAWCEAEMRKASREMGYGDDWKKALEKTKTMHPPPGGQPAMIRDLIFQAIDYLRVHDLVTVPQVDAESQHMIMMTPERQLVNPFFTGGTLMSVSYPTNTMEYDARLQSMRGNNRPWSHATAFHEMIPGHNLVFYYGPRYAGYRANLGASGPFYGEGWAVYWETVLYDKGFDGTPEERVGALFWRMHRCARIIFSLRFHMGDWSPQQAVDFLVDRVGHERENARAEVLRSFQGDYPPLYQAAYLLGALQLRGLRREIVDSRQMTEKAFHDELLRQGSMPIALLRLALTRDRLTRDMPIDWKFYGELPTH